MEKDLKAVILAAGKGTRMKSSLPKVMHEIFNKPLVARVLDSVIEAGAKENIVITGHKREIVDEYLAKNYPSTVSVFQKEQLGTGHAIKCASEKIQNFKGNILILCGDTPLITSKSIQNIVKFHNENNVSEIVEEKDATFEIKKIEEVNAGIYCINWETTGKYIDEIKNDNNQKEYYLTDLIKLAKKGSKKVCPYVLESADEIFGINSRKNLAEAISIMKQRKLDELMESGVTIIDPMTTYISPETTIEPETVILPSVVIEGKNKIGKNCKIGPFAHLRGDCTIADFVKIGNFVELKKANVQSHTNICHLSYVGDSTVGENVNIGAGTITANYDSRTKIKSQTVIKNKASIGSNSVIVAPVEIGENALIGAGSVITSDIKANSLGITRAKQREIENYVK